MSKRRRNKNSADTQSPESPESTEVAVAEQEAVDPPGKEKDPHQHGAPLPDETDQTDTPDTTSEAESADDATGREAAVHDIKDPLAESEEGQPDEDEVQHPVPDGETESSLENAVTGDHQRQPEPSADETGSSTAGPTGDLSPEQVVEAVLFSSDSPLPIAKLTSILGVGSARDVRGHIEALNRKYEANKSAFRIENIAGGYQMLTLPAYNTWVRKLKQTRQESRLSAAALETLAIVAYKQPVVRADIEVLRGVASGEMLNRLRELGLVKIVGRAEDVGRPMLYGTTKRFLEVFGLSSLDELPEVEEFQQPS